MTMAAGIVQELAFVLVIVVSDSPLLSTVTRLFLLLLALAAGTLVARVLDTAGFVNRLLRSDAPASGSG